MALYILSELELRNFTQDKLDAIIATHKTRTETLKNKIPVHITYLTAFEDLSGKHVRFAQDIYGRDDKLMGVLN
jgi:murein L,D-transpeptidase YcbB/YkuD